MHDFKTIFFFLSSFYLSSPLLLNVLKTIYTGVSRDGKLIKKS